MIQKIVGIILLIFIGCFFMLAGSSAFIDTVLFIMGFVLFFICFFLIGFIHIQAVFFDKAYQKTLEKSDAMR